MNNTSEAHKPAQCDSCGGRAELEHIRRGRDRYAQVQCRTCGSAGPEVQFDLSDEWPHIQAEQIALSKWAWMQRER